MKGQPLALQALVQARRRALDARERSRNAMAAIEECIGAADLRHYISRAGPTGSGWQGAPALQPLLALNAGSGVSAATLQAQPVGAGVAVLSAAVEAGADAASVTQQGPSVQYGSSWITPGAAERLRAAATALRNSGSAYAPPVSFDDCVRPQQSGWASSAAAQSSGQPSEAAGSSSSSARTAGHRSQESEAEAVAEYIDVDVNALIAEANDQHHLSPRGNDECASSRSARTGATERAAGSAQQPPGAAAGAFDRAAATQDRARNGERDVEFARGAASIQRDEVADSAPHSDAWDSVGGDGTGWSCSGGVSSHPLPSEEFRHMQEQLEAETSLQRSGSATALADEPVSNAMLDRAFQSSCSAPDGQQRDVDALTHAQSPRRSRRHGSASEQWQTQMSRRQPVNS